MKPQQHKLFDRHSWPGLAVFLALSVTSLTSYAGDRSSSSSRFCDVATLQIDNDEVAGTDRNYTGGVRLACVTSPPEFLQGFTLSEPDQDAIRNERFTYAIGQSIFTPDNLKRSDPIVTDQPYAGWLYLGFGFESEVIPKADRLRYLDNFELQLGVIGPLSGAEQAQRAAHNLVDATDPRGWGNQLDNEPGINLFYSRRWTGAAEFALPSVSGLPDLFFDASPQVGLGLGNVHIFGAGGLTFRLGSFLPDDHGPPVTRPGLPGSDSFPLQKGFSAYLFGGLEGRVVGRNIFLDGNTFTDGGPRVDKDIFVTVTRLGLALTYDDYRLAYSLVYRSEEFEGEEQSRQIFGSLAFSVRF